MWLEKSFGFSDMARFYFIYLMPMKLIPIFLFAFYLCSLVSGPLNAQQLNLKEFGVVDGLPSGVKALMQDTHGYVWMGAENGGLFRYDGKTIKNYTVEDGLPAQGINAICEDNKNQIWLGSYVGLFCFNGTTFIDYSKKINLLSGEYVWRIVKDKKGLLWFGTNTGNLYSYDGKLFVYQNKKLGFNGKTIDWFFIDSKNDLWFSSGARTGQARMFKYNGKKIINYPVYTLAPVVKEPKWTTIFDISEDAHGQIWIGLTDGFQKPGLYGLYKQKFYPYVNTKLSPAVYTINFDAFNNVWVCVPFGLYKGKLPKITGITVDSFLLLESTPAFQLIQKSKYKVLRYFMCDNSNNVWLALSDGVKVFKGDVFTHYGKKQGIEFPVYNIFRGDSDQIWFPYVTSYNWKYLSGDSMFVDFKFPKTTNNVELTGNDIAYTFLDSKGNIWILTYTKGMFLYSKGVLREFVNTKNSRKQTILIEHESKSGLLYGKVFKKQMELSWIEPVGNDFNINYLQLPDENVEALSDYYIDNADSKWVGHPEKGLGIIKGNKVIWYGEKAGLTGGFGMRLLEDSKGRIWVRSKNDNGVFVFENGKFSKINYKGTTTEDFSTLSEDSFGRIWAPTLACGALYFDGQKFVSVTTKDGLIHNSVLWVKQDKHKNLWVGTNRGLSKLFLDEKGKIVRIKNYGFSDGFVGIECNSNSFFEDKKGDLWFGTSTVFTKYNPSADFDNLNPPHLNFTGLKLFYENYDWSKTNPKINTWTGMPKNLTLPYDQNHLTFSFVGVDMKTPDKVRYKFKLEGEENKWSPVVDKTDVTYSALAPGTYTFKVISCNGDGVWNKKPLTYTFTINAPWWQTWWFRTLAALVFVILIYSIYRWRTASLRKNQRILEKTVEERTAEVVHQKHLIMEKHKEMIDSINYAKRIQQSQLPTDSYLDKVLKRLKRK
jgi:ligand-binding sensor domain-containing protein